MKTPGVRFKTIQREEGRRGGREMNIDTREKVKNRDWERWRKRRKTRKG